MNFSRNKYAVTALLALALTTVFAYGRETEDKEVDPRDLSSREFLHYARRPFAQEAWGYFSGTVQHRGTDAPRKTPVELSLLFKKDLIKAQLVLDETQVYNITQVYMGNRPPQITVTPPPKQRGKTSLQELGITPRDLTFAFLYWKFIEESDKQEKVRGQECRIMLLKDPRSETHARVWFSAKYLFPLRVRTLKIQNGTKTIKRELEFTDFKRHKKIWYVKALRLEGPAWKTRVKFDQAELAFTDEHPPPPNLFSPDTTR
ncbi:MAG: hypothetical protein R6V56_01585 [Lentisphaeria bacterium]